MLFVSDKILAGIFIGFFAFLFSHFDIVSWTAHSYFILGFCLFLLGFIVYAKFLETGRSILLFLVSILFLIGMFCYEAFIFWPLSIIILTYIDSLINRKKLTKVKLTVSYLSVVGSVYIVYVVVFFLARSIQTYGDSWIRTYALFLQITSISRIYRTILTVFFNILYNGFLVNIMPAFAYPALIVAGDSNIELGGFLRIHPPTVVDMKIASVILLLAAVWIAIYLFRRKRFDILKIFMFFTFLLFSFAFLLFHLKYFSNKLYLHNFLQFRYQYIPNAFVILLVLLFFDRLLKAAQRTRRIKVILYSVLFMVTVLNIYCTISSISLETRQFAPLNRMLANIKNGIRDGQIDENNKFYLDDSIVNLLPAMCWNFNIAKFMKGTYQWMFNKQEVKYFSNIIKDATWVVDKKDFSITRKSSDVIHEKAIKINAVDEKVDIDLGRDEDYVDLGCFYRNRGRYKEAEAMFKKALQVNPENNDACIYLGDCYQRQGNYSEAEKMFRRAAEINPENAGVYISLGGSYQRQGKYQEAEEMFKKAIEINPENNNAYTPLGECYRIQGNYPKAEAMFKKTLQINPNHPEASYALGECYRIQGNYPKAEAMFKKALQINPNHPEAPHALGHLYNSQNRYQEAEAMFKKALELNPRRASAYDGLSSLYNNLARYPEAEAMFKKALELNPQNDVIYTNLGHFYNSQNRYKEAEAMFKKALELNPRNASAYDALEGCYKKAGKK
ncbi:MAG: tetratricopeptide repeat protein [Candidatus Omnitrophota bacterium]|nr:tetratricopeptide repeat protein [Candidatus Omnitrophota bacterium]